jgi:hypothetical protein
VQYIDASVLSSSKARPHALFILALTFKIIFFATRLYKSIALGFNEHSQLWLIQLSLVIDEKLEENTLSMQQAKAKHAALSNK